MAKVIRLLAHDRGSWPVLGLAAVLMLSLGCSASASFSGTVLNPPQTATSFTLQDQFGQQVSLASLKGKVVVMAFIYTNCPDVCPLTTQTLGMAYDALGDDVKSTFFVAITVDPERDTVEQVYRYSEQKGMLHKWSFLTGSRQELEPVWRAYYVDAEKEISPDAGVQTVPGEYVVGHSTPIYLIDRNGKLRVVSTTPPLVPQPLVHDIRLLLKQS